MTKRFTLQQLVDNFNEAATNNDSACMLQLARQLLERDPANADFMALVLQALDSAGRITEDLGFIQKYVLAKSTDVLGFMLLYRAYIQRNRPLEALLSLTFALNVDPDNTDCQKLLKTLLAEINPEHTHVRLNVMKTNRIGHLAMEIEPWARAVDDHEKGCFYIFVTASSEAPANKYLYQLLRQVAHIVESDFFYQLYISRPLLLTDDSYAQYPYDLFSSLRGVSSLEVSTKGNANLMDIYRDYPPCLTISAEDKKLGWEHLDSFGISASDRFVCLHVRDSAYLKQKMPSQDWSYHNYRDADITTYKESIEYLIDQGYKVIRIGAETDQKLNLLSPSYFDFCANRSSAHGDFIEIFLLSECTFFIGTYGGPYSVAPLFDTPTIVVNAAPAAWPYPKHCHFIPKLLFKDDESVSMIDVINGKRLASDASTPIVSCYSADDLSRYGYQYRDNSSADIIRAVSEFEQRISNDFFDNTPSDIQLAFRDAVSNNASSPITTNLICSSFLNDHPDAFRGMR